MSLAKSIQARDPAQPTYGEVVFGYPGFHALTLFHPLAQWLWKLELRALARFWANIGRMVTGIEIHPQAKIGKNLFIDHGLGVVIGQTAVIGDNCTIYQAVTLGGKGNAAAGTKRHPTLGNDVIVGAGAQVLGAITVGDGARIGAGAVVTKDVAQGATMVGNPARCVGCAPAKEGSYGMPEGDPADLYDDSARTGSAGFQTIRQSIK